MPFNSRLVVLIRTSRIMFTTNGESRHPCLVPGRRGKALSLSPRSMTFAMGFHPWFSLCWNSFWLSLVLCGFFFTHERMLKFFIQFSVSVEAIMGLFPLRSVAVVYYIDRSVHRNRSHLIMVNCPFSMLLIFCEDFCISVRNGCNLVVSLSGFISG